MTWALSRHMQIAPVLYAGIQYIEAIPVHKQLLIFLRATNVNIGLFKSGYS